MVKIKNYLDNYVTIKMVIFLMINGKWKVYGLERAGVNSFIDEFDTEYEAMKKAHSYCLPVMKGSSNSIDVEKTLLILQD